MTPEELIEKLNEIQMIKCETATLELKSAQKGCPKRLYDTLSSFSNQDDGGIIIFGVEFYHIRNADTCTAADRCRSDQTEPS